MMAALESKPSDPVEPFLRGKRDEVSCTTPSFVANLLRNDGMTLVPHPKGGKTGEGEDGSCPLMPPSLEELDALESRGGSDKKKDVSKAPGKLLTSLVQAESPTKEKHSLQPPSLAELESVKKEEREKKALSTKSMIPGLKVQILKQFILPECFADLDLDPHKDEAWQLWSDAFRTRLTAISDKNANAFVFLFLRKIFNPLRECGNCGKTRTCTVPPTDNPLELFVTSQGLVGRIKVHCAACGQTESLPSCEDPEDVPTDARLQISLEKTRGDFVKKIAHQEVLHDLMELLHIAAMEHCLENKRKHMELAEFLLNNARKVCEQWCRLDYRELRIKKFLQFREEVLLINHTPNYYMPARTREYMGMYEMMGNSFRENRNHIHTILQAIKDSLIDSPSRSHCMFWIGITLLHVESYHKFKEKYDPRSCMRIDEGEYWALHDRYIGLDAPVGVKKIPVVFILFELPRFFYYTEFLEKTCGRRTKIYLTKKERFELARAESEAIKRGFSRPKKTGTIISPEKHLDFLVRQEELSRMTRNKKFVDAFNKKQLVGESKKKKKGKKKSDHASKTGVSTEKKSSPSEIKQHSLETFEPKGLKDLQTGEFASNDLEAVARVMPKSGVVEKSQVVENLSEPQTAAVSELQESRHPVKELNASKNLAESKAAEVVQDVQATLRVDQLDLLENESKHQASGDEASLTSEPQANEIHVVCDLQENAVASESQASEVASESQATEVASESQATEVASESQASEVASKSQASEVASESQATEVASESQATEVASESQATEVASESQASEVASESQATEVASESQASEVASKSQASEVASESQASEVAGEFQASKVASESQASEVASESQATEVASESQVSEVASEFHEAKLVENQVEPQANDEAQAFNSKVVDASQTNSESQATDIVSESQTTDLVSDAPATKPVDEFESLVQENEFEPQANAKVLNESLTTQKSQATGEKAKLQKSFEVHSVLDAEKMCDSQESEVVSKPVESEETGVAKLGDKEEKPLYGPEHEVVQVGEDNIKLTRVSKSFLDDRFREEYGEEPPPLGKGLAAFTGLDATLSAKLLEEFLKGKVIPGEIVWIEDDTRSPTEEEKQLLEFLESQDAITQEDSDLPTITPLDEDVNLTHPYASDVVGNRRPLHEASERSGSAGIECRSTVTDTVKQEALEEESVRQKPSAVQSALEALESSTLTGADWDEWLKPVSKADLYDPLASAPKTKTPWDGYGGTEATPIKQQEGKRKRWTESEKAIKVRLYAETSAMIELLMRNGEAPRFEKYLDSVYQEGEWDRVLLGLESKMCAHVLGMGPTNVRDDLRVTPEEYAQIISRALKKYYETRKKPKLIKPEADPSFKNRINPDTYVFRGLPAMGKDLPPAALICTQLSANALRAQGYKVDTQDKMVSVIANRSGVIQHFVEGLETQKEMEVFIEEHYGGPKRGDGASPSPIVGWKYAKGETKKVTGNPKKAKKRAKKLAKLAAQKPKQVEGKSVTLGGRTYTPEDLKALSEGTHPLMDTLPEVDESVDPFDVEALQKMHPWLKHVENTVMEPKTEEECGLVIDKLMTPVPLEGLDPSIPRQLVACPANATTVWDDTAPKGEQNANVNLATAFMTKMEPSSRAKKPMEPLMMLQRTVMAQKPDTAPDLPTPTLPPLSKTESKNDSTVHAAPAIAARNADLSRSEGEYLIAPEDRDTKLIQMLNAKMESADNEELEELIKKKQSKTYEPEDDDDNRVPHRQMRMLDAMEIPYRLDNIKVITDESEKGTVLCKLTLLPFDKPRKKGGKESPPALKKSQEEPGNGSKLSKSQRKKGKQRQAAGQSPRASSNRTPTLDTIEDLKSSSSTNLKSSSVSSDKDDSRSSKVTEAGVRDSDSSISLLKRQESELSTGSGGIDDFKEAERAGESNGGARGRVTARDRFKTCTNCSKEIKDRIQLCAGCKKVAYCNSLCQKADWKVHKKTCAYAVKKRTG